MGGGVCSATNCGHSGHAGYSLINPPRACRQHRAKDELEAQQKEERAAVREQVRPWAGTEFIGL
jgi:hypothetical protein